MVDMAILICEGNKIQIIFVTCRYNVKASLQMVNRFLLMPSSVSTAKFAQGGELFARMKLNSDLSEDTAHGRLILQNVNTVYLAPYDPNKEETTDPRLVSQSTHKNCVLFVSKPKTGENKLV